MTDNEIIKALECCRDCNCKECPCYKVIDGEMRCTEIDEKEILDLINRQKAEVEALYEINAKSDEEISELRKELLKRQNLEESFINSTKQFDKRLEKTVKLERAEAIKEFAKMLIDKAQKGVIYSMDIPDYVIEMVGDDNA